VRVPGGIRARLPELLAVAAGPALALVCLGTGFRDSPAFTLVWSWPLVAGLLFLDRPSLALFAGAPSFLGAAAVLALDPNLAGKPGGIATRALAALLATAVAAAATSFYRRAHLRELRVREERAEALRRQVDAARERARLDRLAMVGGLARGMAHEVNNPLGYVKSNLDWMAHQLRAGALVASPAELHAVLDESLQGVARIERIIAGLRALATDPLYEPADVSIPDAVRQALAADADALLGTRIEVDLPASLPPARGSYHRLVEVLRQLLSNASDALRERPADQRWLRLSARVAGDRVQVEVLDGGPGLAPHVLDRLFQPFVTTKRAGTHVGLGLPIALEQIRRQGGTLEGGNAPGAGACFRVGLPPAAARG